jgi:hypothetical protein
MKCNNYTNFYKEEAKKYSDLQFTCIPDLPIVASKLTKSVNMNFLMNMGIQFNS